MTKCEKTGGNLKMRGAGRGFFGLINGWGQSTWLVSGSRELARRVRMAAGMNSRVGRLVA